jgi:hypothetical protein
MQRTIKAPANLGRLCVTLDGSDSTVHLIRHGKQYHSSVNFANQRGEVYDTKYGCEEVKLTTAQWEWVEQIAETHNL